MLNPALWYPIACYRLINLGQVHAAAPVPRTTVGAGAAELLRTCHA
jgi:hypothetical protein